MFGYGSIKTTFRAQDAYHPERATPIQVMSVSAVPDQPAGGEPEMLRYLRACIWQAERHEADEWFVLDGHRPFDPHAHRQ